MKRFLNLIVAAGVATSLFLFPVFGAQAVEKKLTWVGCGISKKAFMTEMAAAYKKKTGVEITMQGGGATKGIRQVAARKVDLGGTCIQQLAQDFVAKYVVKSSGPLEKGIQKNINGIGISGISSAKRSKVKLLKLEGKEPSYENLLRTAPTCCIARSIWRYIGRIPTRK